VRVNNSDPFNLSNLRLPGPVTETRIETSKELKRREQFAMTPYRWIEKLNGASGTTHQVALRLLLLSWKQGGGPVKLGNKSLEFDAINRYAKRRALANLERRGLVTVERQPRKAPLVQLLHATAPLQGPGQDS
jgi:hypothetical protein